MFESLDAVTVWRAVSVAVLLWLAIFFGRTLVAGKVPLIERIARRSDPDLPAEHCRYTRRLTAIWCGFFVVAMLLPLVGGLPLGWTSALTGAGALLLFVGEHWLRPRFFPGYEFPGLAQQLRDTWNVWRKP